VNRNSAAGYLLICLGCAVGLTAIVLSRPKDANRPFNAKDMPFLTQLKMHALLFVSELNASKLACLIGCAVVAAGVMASLSRGGTLAMLFGGCVTLVFYGMARKPSLSSLVAIPAILFAALIAGWLGFGSQLLDRFEDVNSVSITEQEDSRIKHWTDTFPAVADFGPFGSGVGAYSQVHRLYRSDPEQAIFVYAESQFFQTVVELGWPGFVLLIAAWALSWYCSIFLLYRGSSVHSVGFGVAGVFTTSAVAVASAFDFGLYYTANMLFMAVCCGFVAYHAQALSGRLRKGNWLRFGRPCWQRLFFYCC